MTRVLVNRLMVLTLATALGAMVTLSPVAMGTAKAASGREAGLAAHRDPAALRMQRWTAPRRWATADDWEPNVAASQTSAWVYQLTTRYSHPSQCARAKGHCIVFRASANRGRTWKATRAVPSRYCPPARHRCVLARNQNDPVLAVSAAGVIYAAWMDDWDVVFMRSADHGRTWHDQADFRRAAGLSFTDKPGSPSPGPVVMSTSRSTPQLLHRGLARLRPDLVEAGQDEHRSPVLVRRGRRGRRKRVGLLRRERRASERERQRRPGRDRLGQRWPAVADEGHRDQPAAAAMPGSRLPE